MVGGKNYLRAVAKSDPRTFCTKLGKILPTQVLGPQHSAVQKISTDTPGAPAKP